MTTELDEETKKIIESIRPEVTIPVVPQNLQRSIESIRLLEVFVPPTTFSGSLDEIQLRAEQILQSYESKIPQLPTIPSIPSLDYNLVPRIPSYAEIKEFIYNKIKEIKQKQQEAFITAQNIRVEEAKTPFTLRKNLVNKSKNIKITNTVLGRINNR